MKKLLIAFILIICYTTANCQAIKEKIDTSLGYYDKDGNVTYYAAPESCFKVDSTGKRTNVLRESYLDSIETPKRTVIHKKKKATVSSK